jgi:hypothetical protein
VRSARTFHPAGRSAGRPAVRLAARFAAAAALLTAITGVATFPASASPTPAAAHGGLTASAGSAVTIRPVSAAALAGPTPLTLSNGTRIAVAAPWTATASHPGTVGQVHAFAATEAGFFCFFGAEQNLSPRKAPVQKKVTKYALTIKGTNLAGGPDTGDQVQVFSATNMRWNEQTIGPTPIFRNGQVTLHVPAGKYWLIGQFVTAHSFRMDIPQQVTVTGDTTAAVSARAASSELSAATPRPAVLINTVFSSSYTVPGGKTFEDCGTQGNLRLWVSPLARAQTTGTMYSATSAQLDSPPGQKSPYTYELDSAAPPGTIASQHLTVTTADLATVHERFYSDTAATAPWFAFGGPARQYSETGFTAASTSLPMPGVRTVYFQAQPTAVWRPEIPGTTLTETPTWQLYQAGQDTSTNWNSYPLHPAPNLPPVGVTDETLASASRTGNTLILDVTPDSDNTPGHSGSGPSLFNGVKGHGRYAVYANGSKIASGKVSARSPGDVFVSTTLSPKPSRIGFTLTTSRQAPGSNLSGTTQDSWTWPSRPDPRAVVPSPWYCGASFTHGRLVFDRHCAVQDMMTLDYQLAGEGLDGSTPAGRQSLGLAVNHLPTATPYPVTDATLQVSYDHGTSWQPATLTRICHGQVCTNH